MHIGWVIVSHPDTSIFDKLQVARIFHSSFLTITCIKKKMPNTRSTSTNIQRSSFLAEFARMQADANRSLIESLLQTTHTNVESLSTSQLYYVYGPVQWRGRSPTGGSRSIFGRSPDVERVC